MILYYVGWIFEETLHDFLVFLPTLKFKNVSWFNEEIYLATYEKWSCGLRNLLALIFAITFGGLFFIVLIDVISLLLKRA